MTTPKHDDRSAAPVDPRVAAAWHASSNEVPPASVDAAILAAARREVAAGPEPIDTREARADRRRWWPLAAAATIAAVVVGLLQMTPLDKLGAPATDTTVVSDVPTPATPQPVPESTPSAPSTKEEKPARNDTPPVETPPPPAPRPLTQRAAAPAAPLEPSQRIAAAPPATSTPDPFPAAPKPAADDAAAATGQRQLAASAPPRAEGAANVARERDSISRPDAPPASVAAQAQSRTAEATAPAPAAPSAPLAKMAAGSAADSGVDETRAKERTPLPVQEWIALIRRLRAEGKVTEAAKELTAFRAAHADHEKLLPLDLRDWRLPEK